MKLPSAPPAMRQKHSCMFSPVTTRRRKPARSVSRNLSLSRKYTNWSLRFIVGPSPQALENALADIVQVFVNRRDDRDRFAFDDRASNRAVLLPRPLDDRGDFASVVAGVQDLMELGRPEQSVEHLAVQFGQELIAARGCDQPMEPPVELTEIIELHRWRELLGYLGELTALRGSRPTGSKLGHLYFDDPSGLEEITHHHLA